MLECRILTSEAEVGSIASEWRQLQAAAGRIPYTDYDWFDSWWRNIGKPGGKTLYVVAGRVDRKLAAILPLSIRRKNGARILQGIGVEASYTCDILSESPEHAKALWETVRQDRQYDFAAIKDVDPDSACGQALASFARQCSIEKIPYLDITWNDSKAWLASLSSNARSEYNRRMRRLQEKGKAQYHVHTTSPVPANIIDEMIKQKLAWYIEHKKRGIFDLNGTAAFFHQLSATAAGSGQLFLSWLQCENQIAACFFGFRYRETFYFYTISNDPAWGHFSPGNLMLVNAISWAIDNGCRQFDFLQGVYAYKLRYANRVKDYIEWTFSVSPSGYLMEGIYVGYRKSREWLYQRWKGIESRRDSNLMIKAAYLALEALRRGINSLGKKPASQPDAGASEHH